MGEVRLFKRITDHIRVTDHIRINFRVVKATWRWPGRSVADEIGSGQQPEVVRWLALEASKTTGRLLQWSMGQAWDADFDHHPASYWLPTVEPGTGRPLSADVTPTTYIHPSFTR